MRTVLHAAGQLPQLLTALDPMEELPGVAAITPAFLREKRIAGIIWDLDGTLTSHGASEIHPGVHAHVMRLLQIGELHDVVLSNARSQRLRALSACLPGIPFIKGYQAGSNLAFRIFQDGKDSWTDGVKREAAAVRKPDQRLVEFAIAQTGVTDRDRIALVGDQYITDIAPANLASLLSVKVPTLEPASFPLPVRALQLAERAVRAGVTSLTRRPGRSRSHSKP
jgi:predicted HAD superfamily phosphohydrolase YqeG